MPKLTPNPSHDKEPVQDGTRQSKYGNQRTEVDGDVYDSKHEAQIAALLALDCKAGYYKGMARQVPFYLPGGVKYIADFVVFHTDGRYEVIDAKSEATKNNAVYRLKKRQMRECLGITITEA